MRKLALSIIMAIALIAGLFAPAMAQKPAAIDGSSDVPELAHIPRLTLCQLGPNPAGKVLPAPQAGFRHLKVPCGNENYKLFITYKGAPGCFVPFGPFDHCTNVKFTKAPGADPRIMPMAGAVKYHIILPGDPVIIAVCTQCDPWHPVAWDICKGIPPHGK